MVEPGDNEVVANWLAVEFPDDGIRPWLAETEASMEIVFDGVWVNMAPFFRLGLDSTESCFIVVDEDSDDTGGGPASSFACDTAGECALGARRHRRKKIIFNCGLFSKIACTGRSAGNGRPLAKAIFDLFSWQFEASYLFSSFADASLHRDRQSDFFSKLLGDESGGKLALSYELRPHRLGRMKALVVIDDVGSNVSNIGPLKDLLNGECCDLFGHRQGCQIAGRSGPGRTSGSWVIGSPVLARFSP
ncbi:unnamed protein product [Linum trigynum]|uniref:Uncharacterized protein n=1 Tax=Linum trigynum TaxID=586398 RepID=A0AAV2FA02_9ROSI